MEDAHAPEALRLVRAHLARTYRPLIDMADASSTAPERYDAAFLSRALAAKAIELLTGCMPQEAADAVVDGLDDFGIDAIAISPDHTDIWLVQAKWSDHGRARFTQTNATMIVHALQRLADRQFQGFNARIHAIASQIDMALSSLGCRVHLVAAVAGESPLSPQVLEQLSQVQEGFGFADRIPVTVHALGLADFHSAARSTAARPPSVTVSATLTDGWHSTRAPYPAYIGTAWADELASWYTAHRSRLLAPSLRGSPLPEQTVAATVAQITDEPENFCFISNGVTVVCDRLTPRYLARKSQGEPLELQLHNAQIVNGAHTIAAIARAAERRPAEVARARVLLRVICLDGDTELANKIAASADRPLAVDALDFVSLDPIQQLLRDEFAAILGKDYVTRRGAVAPAPSAGCTLQEAAVALACAHPDVTLMAHAATDPSYLWRPAPDGAYSRLFSDVHGAQQVWQAVLLLRQVRTVLAGISSNRRSTQDIIKHGDLMIAHLVFQSMGPDLLDELRKSSNHPRPWLAELTRYTIHLLTRALEENYGPHIFTASVFTDAQRLRHLAPDLLGLLRQHETLHSASTHRPQRRPNSIAVLLDQRAIPDGTRCMYQPTRTEEAAIGVWLSEDPTRYLATWTNIPRTPLRWEVDQQSYHPSELLRRIWNDAGWQEAPAAVQGSRRWVIPGKGTLADIAEALLPSRSTSDEEI